MRSRRRDWRSLRRGCWTIQRRRKIPLKIPLKILTRRNQILRTNQKRKKMKRKRRRRALG